MTETEEYVRWYENEKKNGLIDIKFVPGDSITRDTTREDFAAENNRVNRLIVQNKFVHRPDVF
jgi:hypothetical protein